MLKRVLRTAQTHAPWVRPLKFAAYNAATRYLGLRIDPEFKLLKLIGPVDLAIDIGANWGQSIAALQRLCAPKRIVAFEPSALLARRIERRYAGNDKVTLHACALGESDGEFTLHTPRYGNFVFDGLASLDIEEARNWLNPRRMAGFDPSKLSIDSQTVKVRQLDSFDLSPDVVKIDVQGAELLVVRGGLETFRRSQPVSIVENPSPELVALFAGIGMHAFGFDGHTLTRGDVGGNNTVFLNERRVDQLQHKGVSLR